MPNTLESLLQPEAPENPLLEVIQDPIAAITISDGIRDLVGRLIAKRKENAADLETAKQEIREKLLAICTQEGLEKEDQEKALRVIEGIEETQEPETPESKTKPEYKPPVHTIVPHPVERNSAHFDQLITQITQTTDERAKLILRYFRTAENAGKVSIGELTNLIGATISTTTWKIIEKHLTDSRPFFIKITGERGKGKRPSIQLAHTLEPPPKEELPIPKNAVQGPIQRGHPLYEKFQQFYHHSITSPKNREIMYFMSKIHRGMSSNTTEIVRNTSIPNTNTATVLIKTLLTKTRPFYIEQVEDPKNTNQKLLFLCYEESEDEEDNIIPENTVEGPITNTHKLHKELEKFLENSKGGTHEKIIRILASSTNRTPTTIQTIETTTDLKYQSIRRALEDLETTKPFYVATKKHGRTSSTYLCYQETDEENKTPPPETTPSEEKSKNPLIKSDPIGTKQFLAQFAETQSTFKVAKFLTENLGINQRTTYKITSKNTEINQTFLIKLMDQFLNSTPYKLLKYTAGTTTIFKLVANQKEEDPQEESEISEEEKDLFLEWKLHPSVIGRPVLQKLIDHLSNYPIGSSFQETELAEILEIRLTSFQTQVAPLLAETEPICLVLKKGKYQTKRPEDEDSELEHTTKEDKLRRRRVLKLLTIFEENALNPLHFEPEIRALSLDDKQRSAIVNLIRSKVSKLESKLREKEIVVDQVCRQIDLLIEKVRKQFREIPEIENALKIILKRERESLSRELKFKAWEESAKGKAAKKIVQTLEKSLFKPGDKLYLEDIARLTKLEETTVKKVIRGTLLDTTPLRLEETHEKTGVYSYTITENETKEKTNGIPEFPIFPVKGPIHPSHPLYPLLQETLANLGNAERIKEILKFLAERPPHQIVTYMTIAEKTNAPNDNAAQAIVNMHLDEDDPGYKTTPFAAKKSLAPGTQRTKQLTLWCRGVVPRHKTTMRTHPLCDEWLKSIGDQTIRRLARVLTELGPRQIISTNQLIERAYKGKIPAETEREARSAIPRMLGTLTNNPEIHITKYIENGRTYLGISLSSADVTEWASKTPRKEPERKTVETILERFFTSRTHPITLTKLELKKMTGLTKKGELDKLIEILNQTPNFSLIQSTQDKKEVMFVSTKQEITDDLEIIE